MRVDQIEGEEIHGKVGFRLPEQVRLPREWRSEAEIEVMEATYSSPWNVWFMMPKLVLA